MIELDRRLARVLELLARGGRDLLRRDARHRLGAMRAREPHAAGLAAGKEIAMQVVTRRRRRDKAAEDDDRAQAERGGGVMQAALRRNEERGAGEDRGGLAHIGSNDMLDALEELRPLWAELDQAPIAQEAREPLPAPPAPILIGRGARLDIRLEDDRAGARAPKMSRSDAER
jgi:hypothetical protein